jgi:glycine/D-amino acid oxidase-like deaminating enzyme
MVAVVGGGGISLCLECYLREARNLEQQYYS